MAFGGGRALRTRDGLLQSPSPERDALWNVFRDPLPYPFIVVVGEQRQRRQARQHERADEPRDAHRRIVWNEEMTDPDHVRNEERERDRDDGKVRRDYGGFSSRIEASFILLRRDQNPDRGGGEPRGHRVDGGAAGQPKHETEDVSEERADELHEPEVGEERQQERREEEERQDDGGQIVENGPPGLFGPDDLGAETGRRRPPDESSENPERVPDRAHDEQAVPERVRRRPLPREPG